MTTRRISLPFLGILLAGFGLGSLAACFDGIGAYGLPCETDAHCGPISTCIDGYCGGEILCGDTTFVPANQACDGRADCNDGIDEDLDRCEPVVGEKLCELADALEQACQMQSAPNLMPCMPFANLDNECEDGPLDDPCMDSHVLEDACDMFFGANSEECEPFDDFESICGDPSGDGDGDGDGDTPAVCEMQVDDGACVACLRESCCTHVVMCYTDEPACSCAFSCINAGGSVLECQMTCNAQNVIPTEALQCGVANCADSCT